MEKYDFQSIPFRNREGYADPTVWLALRNVEMQRLLEEKLRKRIAENESAKRKTAKWQQMAVSVAEREELREDERFVWEELANAIIIQAAEDWRAAVTGGGGLARCRESFAQTPDQHGRKEMHPGNGDVFPV